MNTNDGRGATAIQTSQANNENPLSSLDGKEYLGSMLRQSLQALSFLHENGIAHGDFQPGKILFTLNDIDSNPEDVLRQKEDVQARSISPPVERLDGKEDKWAPQYLCVGQPLVPFTRYTEGFKVKLSDMGGGQSLPTFLVAHIHTHTYLS